MNILYCGHEKMEKGLLISLLSLLKHVDEELHIYFLTMRFEQATKTYLPLSSSLIECLDSIMKQVNPEHFIKLIDITTIFYSQPPTANLETRFVPFCMLQLYADLIPELPEKILYLNTDVILRQDCRDFYHQDLKEYEIAGVLDYYGRWLHGNKLFRHDYLNSGVLLMNLSLIKETGLLHNCRQLCAKRKRVNPDQFALNKMATAKKICPRRFNEQHQLQEDTVMHHFCTTLHFFPWFHTQTVKPWQIDRVHRILDIHEYDHLFFAYMQLWLEIKTVQLKRI